jgi:hypothetical protein
VLAAALVADPAGDADVEVEVEVVEQLALVAGEAVRDGARDAVPHRLEHRDQVVVRLALVQEQRLAGGQREPDLALEREQLRRARRVVAVVVEAGFAHGAHARIREQRPELALGVGGELRGVVRVHPGRGVQHCRDGAPPARARPATRPRWCPSRSGA